MVNNSDSPTILFASNNKGKVFEVRSVLGVQNIAIVTPQELDASFDSEVEETGKTFAENALLKAKTIGDHFGYPTIADDSGLEVFALNGEPGIHSNRWFSGTDADRNSALLNKLVDAPNRNARYVCVTCLYVPASNAEHYFEGTVNGVLAEEPRGKNGFGYDPIFIPESFDQTFGELGTELKNKLSHRAQALTKLLTFLKANPLALTNS